MLTKFHATFNGSLHKKVIMIRNTTITNRRQPHGTVRKSRSTITRHQEDKSSKATSSLFPIKMIAKLEWTQSNTQQNIRHYRLPLMGVTIKKSQQQQNHNFIKLTNEDGSVEPAQCADSSEPSLVADTLTNCGCNRGLWKHPENTPKPPLKHPKPHY